ncbi:MAG: Ig-like domain repeat protein [Planctomycetes bacterium]|nr:Ig-like domain repeat protein [Planctomycetota bacterium]
MPRKPTDCRLASTTTSNYPSAEFTMDPLRPEDQSLSGNAEPAPVYKLDLTRLEDEDLVVLAEECSLPAAVSALVVRYFDWMQHLVLLLARGRLFSEAEIHSAQEEALLALPQAITAYTRLPQPRACSFRLVLRMVLLEQFRTFLKKRVERPSHSEDQVAPEASSGPDHEPASVQERTHSEEAGPAYDLDMTRMEDEALVVLAAECAYPAAVNALAARYFDWTKHLITLLARGKQLPPSAIQEAQEQALLALPQAVADYDQAQTEAPVGRSFRSFLGQAIVAGFQKFLQGFRALHTLRARQPLARRRFSFPQVAAVPRRPLFLQLEVLETRELMNSTPLTITGLSPNFGPTAGGTSVLINGTGLDSVTGVSFGGTPATSFTYNTSTANLTAVAPAEPSGQVDVVLNASGQGTSPTSAADLFTFTGSSTSSSSSSFSGGSSGSSSSTYSAGSSGSSSSSSGSSPAATAAYSSSSSSGGSSSSSGSGGSGGSGSGYTYATTSTSLTSSLNPALMGQQVTLTATVTSGGGNPTGPVNFYNGNNLLGTSGLDGATGNDQATLTLSNLPLGTDGLTAQYGGLSSMSPSVPSFAGSTSDTLEQVVLALPTSTSLTSSLNPSTYGQAVTFTATVASSYGTPVGTLTFYDNGVFQTSGAATQASWTTNTLNAGSQDISAVFTTGSASGSSGGSSLIFASSSADLTEVVKPLGTTTSLTSSLNPSLVSQPVTLTATVVPNGPAPEAPTGWVTFSNGLGSVYLDGSGSVSLTVTSLPLGTSTLTASFGGSTDGNFLGNSSGTLKQVVNPIPTSTSLTSALNPAYYGQPVTFTAFVSYPTGVTIQPTGTVTFSDGSTPLGQSGLTFMYGQAEAVWIASTLPVGTHTLTANYNGSGDGNFLSSGAGPSPVRSVWGRRNRDECGLGRPVQVHGAGIRRCYGGLLLPGPVL